MSSSQPAYHLDAVNSRGVGVRVKFDRVGDCFSHTLYAAGMDDEEPIARSVMATWKGVPSSPPVQEIRETQEPTGGRTILLMGAAAAGHWSGTVRVARFDQANPYIEFDFAVRLWRQPILISTAYETLGRATWSSAQAGTLAFAHGDPHVLVISAPFGKPEDLKTSDGPLECIEHPGKPRVRVFVPTTKLPQQYPATYRWRYCISSGLA
jgi:hypothetical protein